MDMDIDTIGLLFWFFFWFLGSFSITSASFGSHGFSKETGMSRYTLAKLNPYPTMTICQVSDKYLTSI